MNRFAMLGAALALGAFAAPSALADDNQDGKHKHDGHRPDFAAMHAMMCKDRFAHAVGRTAYLEAKLSLNPQQQSLFDAWKGAVLSSAQSEASACAAETRPEGMRLDALARMNHMEAHLQARLAALQAELPALTALYQSLSPEQKRAFDTMGHHHHHGMMGHGMWMHHHGMGGDGDHRPDGEHHPDGDGG